MLTCRRAPTKSGQLGGVLVISAFNKKWPKKGNMKQFKIDVSHASPGQLLTIAAELKIMSNNWEKFGPRILINGAKLQAPSLRIPGTGRKHGPRSGTPQATSFGHN